MPREVIRLPQDETYPQRTAANFLAVVAYPNDRDRQQKFMVAVGGTVLRQRARADPKWAWQPQQVTPALLALNPKQCARIIEDCALELITRRLPAAQMGKTLLADESLKKFPPIPVKREGEESSSEEITKLTFEIVVPIEEYDPRTDQYITKKVTPSVNTLAEHTAQLLNNAPAGWAKRSATGWNPNNVITRLWTPTKPVLHMAIALHNVMTENFEGRPCRFAGLLDPNWVPTAVFGAEMLRQEIVKTQRLRIEEEDTIQVLLAANSETDATYRASSEN